MVIDLDELRETAEHLSGDESVFPLIVDAIIQGGGGGGAVASVNGQVGVVVLIAADVGADPAGTSTAGIAAHVAAPDPHPQYLTQTEGDGLYDPFGAAAAAQAASQPLDADLTAIAALSTEAYGRSLLTLADSAALIASAGLGTMSTQNANAVSISGGTIAGVTSLGVSGDETVTGKGIWGSATLFYTGQTVGVNSSTGIFVENIAGVPIRATTWGLQASVGCDVDLRGIRGTRATPLAMQSGDIIASIHVGAATNAAAITSSGGGLSDVAHISCVATENYTNTTSGARWDFYVNKNSSGVISDTSKALALRLNQDGSIDAGFGTYGAVTSATFSISNVGAVTAPNVLQLDGVTNTVTGAIGTFGVFAYGNPPTFGLNRRNGTSGSPTQVLSGEEIAVLAASGYNAGSGSQLGGTRISSVAEQDFTTAGYRGSGLRFWTAASSVASPPVVRAGITNDGVFFFGSSNGAAVASVTQAGIGTFVGVTTPYITATGGYTVIDGSLLVTGSISFAAVSSYLVNPTYDDDTTTHYAFSGQTVYEATTGSLALATDNSTLDSQPTIRAIGSGAVASGGFYAGRSRMTVAGAATVTNRYGWVFEDATLSSFSGAPYTRNTSPVVASGIAGGTSLYHGSANYFIAADVGASVVGPGVQPGTTVTALNADGGFTNSGVTIDKPLTGNEINQNYTFTRSTSGTGYTATSSGPGAITTQYGLKIGTLTGAATNWGIYCEADSYFAGSFLIEPTAGGGIAPASIRSFGNVPALRTIRYNGTVGSPTKVVNTNTIGQWVAAGQYDTTVGHIVNAGSIRALATEDWAGTSTAGMKWAFYTMPNSGATALVALTLDQDQTATFAAGITGTSASFAGTLATTGTGGTLTVSANAVLFGTSPATQTATYDMLTVASGTAITNNAASIIIGGVRVAPTHNFSTALGGSGFLKTFVDSSTIQNTSGSSNVLTGNYTSFHAEPTLAVSSAHAQTITAWQALRVLPVLSPNGATGTLTVQNLFGVRIPGITVPANATVTTMAGLSMAAPTNSGTLTNWIGVDIPAVTAASTLNAGIRNASSLLQQGALVGTPNTVSVSSNAGTVAVTNFVSNFTNSSAATMTITMATTGAADGQISIVRVYDATAAAQTITWVNTENGEGTAPTTSNGSTTLPKTVMFMFNGATSKWRCIIT